MGRYSPRKSPSDVLSRGASITSPLLSANLFFHSLLMNHWRKPSQKQIFSTQIEFTAHIQIVLSCLILLNVCQLGQVHQVSQITAALTVQFVRDSSV